MKRVNLLKVVIFLSGVLIILAFIGCSFLSKITSGDKAHLTAKGYVSRSAGAGKAINIVSKGTGEGFINNYDQVSLTPAKLLLTIVDMTLWENYEIVDNVVQGSGKNIQIEINSTKNLTELDTFTPIFNIDQEINADQIGTYKCLYLHVDDKSTVSGSVTVNGRTYSFNDQELSLGWGAIRIPLPDEAAISVTEDSEQTAGIVIDIEDALYIWRSDETTLADCNSGCIMLDTNPSVLLAYNQPVILPFVGNAEPNVKRVSLDITNDNDFDTSNSNSDYYLRVLCILDENDNLMSAGWMPIYGDEETGKTANMLGFSPAMLSLQSIVKNADGSYKIDDINYGDSAVRSRALHFPAFQVGVHTGIFYYGDESFSDRKTAQYTAVMEN